MRTTHVALIVLGLTVFGGAAFIAWRRAGAETPAAPVQSSSAADLHRQDIQSRWDAAPVIALQADQRSIVLAGVTERIRDGAAALNPDQQNALAISMTNELFARTGTPDDLVAYSASIPHTRWIDERDDAPWSSLDRWFEFVHQSKSPRTDPNSLLRMIAEHQFSKDGCRFVAAGVAPESCSVQAWWVNSLDQIEPRTKESLSPERFAYWFEAPTVAPLRTRVPERSLENVLKSDDTALIACVSVLVRTERQFTFNLFSVWYWEPRSGSWQCAQFARKGWQGYLCR